MTVKLEHLMLAVACVLLITGCILGFTPVTKGGVGCGSAFTGYDADGAFKADLTTSFSGTMGTAQDDCATAVSSRKPAAFALTAAGLFFGLGGVGVAAAGRQGGRVSGRTGA